MKSIVFISSDARSGSTMLDLLLSSHKDIGSVGELRHLEEHYERKEICMCGEEIPECDFWISAERELRRKNPRRYRNGLGKVRTKIRKGKKRLVRYLPSATEIFLTLCPPPVFRHIARCIGPMRESARAAENCIDICTAASKVTGCHHIVDSSKWTEQFKAMYLARPDLVKIIHLVRDGRAVVHSQLQRSNLNSVQASLLWVLNNLKIMVMKTFVSHRAQLFVRYEDLCANPQSEVKKILQFIGVVECPKKLRVKKTGGHNIGGSPHKFDRTQEDICLDDKWKKVLEKRDLRHFKRTGGGILNGWFGYSN